MSENILFNAVVNGDRERVIKAIQEAIENGEKADIILQEGIVKGMAEVGRLFEEGEFWPNVDAARTVKMVCRCQTITQWPIFSPWKDLDRTVKGDLHDIGKNLVSIGRSGCQITPG